MTSAMIKFHGRLGSAFTLVWLLAHLAVVNAADKENLQVHLKFDNGNLFLHASEASVREVVTEISKEYPFEVRFFGNSSAAKRSWQIDQKPLADSLKHLLRDHSFMMFYDTEAGAEPKLAKLHVFLSDDQPENQVDESTAESVTPSDVVKDPAYYEVNNLESMRDEASLEMLAKNLKTNDNYQARRRALELLAAWNTEAANAHIISALGDDSEEVLLTAVSILQQWQTQESLQLLAQMVYGNSQTSVRVSALEGIANFRNEHREVVKAFLSSVADDEDQAVSKVAQDLKAQFGLL